MAISKLQLVEIEFPETMSDEILSKLVDSEEFHPEPASKFVDSVRGLKVMNKDNPYAVDDEVMAAPLTEKEKALIDKCFSCNQVVNGETC